MLSCPAGFTCFNAAIALDVVGVAELNLGLTFACRARAGRKLAR